jgi:hypothetical protein
MENNFSRSSLTWDGVNLNGLSFQEYIPVKLNGFVWVNCWKMPARRKVHFGNGFRRF